MVENESELVVYNLVVDFSKVTRPSVRFRFLTLMLVTSETLPAEKYKSSASREYFSGSDATRISSWSLESRADFPLLLGLHI